MLGPCSWQAILAGVECPELVEGLSFRLSPAARLATIHLKTVDLPTDMTVVLLIHRAV
jgi:hypothetical protein